MSNIKTFPSITPIEDYVIDTLRIRLYDRNYMTKCTPFVRLISGVSIGDKRAAITGLSNIFDKYESTYDFDINKIYGVVSTSNTNVFRPAAGIESITVDFKNKFGSIRKVTVNWICNSRTELEQLAPYFLTQAYSAYVDWGWITPIFNADSKLIQSLSKPIDPNINFNSGIPTVNAILTDNTNFRKDFLDYKLAKNKASSGNYDCLIGIITNYTVAIKEDGSYACTTEITNGGIIAEGQSVDVTANEMKEDAKTKYLQSINDYFHKTYYTKILSDSPIYGGGDTDDVFVFVTNDAFYQGLVGNKVVDANDFNTNIAKFKQTNPIFLSWGYIEDNILPAIFNIKKDDEQDVIKFDSRDSVIGYHPALRSTDFSVCLLATKNVLDIYAKNMISGYLQRRISVEKTDEYNKQVAGVTKRQSEIYAQIDRDVKNIENESTLGTKDKFVKKLQTLYYDDFWMCSIIADFASYIKNTPTMKDGKVVYNSILGSITVYESDTTLYKNSVALYVLISAMKKTTYLPINSSPTGFVDDKLYETFSSLYEGGSVISNKLVGNSVKTTKKQETDYSKSYGGELFDTKTLDTINKSILDRIAAINKQFGMKIPNTHEGILLIADDKLHEVVSRYVLKIPKFDPNRAYSKTLYKFFLLTSSLEVIGKTYDSPEFVKKRNACISLRDELSIKDVDGESMERVLAMMRIIYPVSNTYTGNIDTWKLATHNNLKDIIGHMTDTWVGIYIDVMNFDKLNIQNSKQIAKKQYNAPFESFIDDTWHAFLVDIVVTSLVKNLILLYRYLYDDDISESERATNQEKANAEKEIIKAQASAAKQNLYNSYYGINLLGAGNIASMPFTFGVPGREYDTDVRRILINATELKDCILGSETVLDGIVKLFNRVNNSAIKYWNLNVVCDDNGTYKVIDTNTVSYDENQLGPKLYQFSVFDDENTLIKNMTLSSKLSNTAVANAFYSVQKDRKNSMIYGDSNREYYVSLYKTKNIQNTTDIFTNKIQSETFSKENVFNYISSSMTDEYLLYLESFHSKQFPSEYLVYSPIEPAGYGYYLDFEHYLENNTNGNLIVDVASFNNKYVSDNMYNPGVPGIQALLYGRNGAYSPNTSIFTRSQYAINLYYPEYTEYIQSVSVVDKKIPLNSSDGMKIACNSRLKTIDYNTKSNIIDSRTDQSSTYLLPIQLELEMKGISGFKLGDIFLIDYVPDIYKENGVFQITGISDGVNVDGWYTKIQAGFRVIEKSRLPDYNISYVGGATTIDAKGVYDKYLPKDADVVTGGVSPIPYANGNGKNMIIGDINVDNFNCAGGVHAYTAHKYLYKNDDHGRMDLRDESCEWFGYGATVDVDHVALDIGFANGTPGYLHSNLIDLGGIVEVRGEYWGYTYKHRPYIKFKDILSTRYALLLEDIKDHLGVAFDFDGEFTYTISSFHNNQSIKVPMTVEGASEYYHCWTIGSGHSHFVIRSKDDPFATLGFRFGGNSKFVRQPYNNQPFGSQYPPCLPEFWEYIAFTPITLDLLKGIYGTFSNGWGGQTSPTSPFSPHAKTLVRSDLRDSLK